MNLTDVSGRAYFLEDERRAALLYVLYHHQGGSSPVGQPIRAMLGIHAYAHLTDEQLAEAKRVGAAIEATEKPRAYMRRWAFDGEKPHKVLNEETGRMHTPFRFKLMEVTPHRIRPDDVPLYPRAQLDDEMVRRASLAYEVAMDGEVYGPQAPAAAMRAALEAALGGAR